MEISCGYTKDGKSWVSLTELFFKIDTIEIDEIRSYFEQIYDKFDYFYLLFHSESVGIDLFSTIRYITLRDMVDEFNIQDKFFLIDAELNKNSVKNLMIENYISGFITRNLIKQKDVSIKKHFVCHNNQKKIHRDYIVNFIKSRNIEDKMFLSYHYGNSPHDTSKLSSLTHEYYSSFCNIVTETYFQESTDFIFTFTEKLFKPIVAEIPFILAAQHKSLEKLKEMGFKTFDKWWDESYDLEIDTELRLAKICDVILEISTWELDKCIETYNEMKSVLSHNSELYKKIHKEWDWLHHPNYITLT